MRYALLVAIREYSENARTKGFWIGIFILPLVIVLSIFVMTMLNEATPTRYITINDQSHHYLEKIHRDLDRLHQRDVLAAFNDYVQKYAAPTMAGAGEIDLESMPAIDPKNTLERFSEDNPDALELFVREGGLDNALIQIGPSLPVDAPAFSEPKRRYQLIDLPDEITDRSDLQETSRQMKAYLLGEQKVVVEDEEQTIFAFIQIPRDVADAVSRPSLVAPGKTDGVQYWSVNLADTDVRDAVERAINKETRRLEYLARGIDAQVVSDVQSTHVPFIGLNAKKEAGQEHVSVADQVRQWAPVGFVYVLWIAIFSISQMLLNNTVEEKSNRIIEVLLSSVTPSELMFGKLLGIAGVGLTMLASWIAALIGILVVMQSPQSKVATLLLEVLGSSGLIPAFAMYFILGYLMYSGLFLAIGSVCNTIKDAQNLQGPIMLIMIIPLFTMTFIPKDPNGTLATVMSWIPLFTPFVMMNRAAADPPMFDVIGTMVLLVITTILVLYMAAKVFRIGILRTGQPPKLLELVRWLKG
jgi:ABC-2 type transport system permease protein